MYLYRRQKCWIEECMVMVSYVVNQSSLCFSQNSKLSKGIDIAILNHSSIQHFCLRYKYTLFFYKNTLYENVHDENGQKIKNIVRILPSWKFSIFFFFRIYFQMHLKPSRADLADLFYFIFLIAFRWFWDYDW